jgi:hypothetical protein
MYTLILRCDTTLHQEISIGNYVFKRMDNFKCLCTMVNKMNSRSVEVKARLTMANRAYYGLQNHMKSRIISRNTKTLLYKTLIIPVLFWGGNGVQFRILPLEALQPVWLTPEVYCNIPVFLIVPTLAAMCLSRPQTAVVP